MYLSCQAVPRLLLPQFPPLATQFQVLIEALLTAACEALLGHILLAHALRRPVGIAGLDNVPALAIDHTAAAERAVLMQGVVLKPLDGDTS